MTGPSSPVSWYRWFFGIAAILLMVAAVQQCSRQESLEQAANRIMDCTTMKNAACLIQYVRKEEIEKAALTKEKLHLALQASGSGLEGSRLEGKASSFSPEQTGSLTVTRQAKLADGRVYYRTANVVLTDDGPRLGTYFEPLAEHLRATYLLKDAGATSKVHRELALLAGIKASRANYEKIGLRGFLRHGPGTALFTWRDLEIRTEQAISTLKQDSADRRTKF